MKLDKLDIWGSNSPAQWAREAAGRWAAVVRRAAAFVIDLFAQSPLPRLESEMLMLLWEDPDEGEPAKLASRLRISRQSMTGLLDKLESGGYVKRVPHPTDRRRKIIRLEAAGLDVVRQFGRSVLLRAASHFEAQSETEVNAALRDMDRLLSIVEAWRRNDGRTGTQGGE